MSSTEEGERQRSPVAGCLSSGHEGCDGSRETSLSDSYLNTQSPAGEPFAKDWLVVQMTPTIPSVCLSLRLRLWVKTGALSCPASVIVDANPQTL